MIGDVEEDADGDGLADPADNCPLTVNPQQVDADDDGFGDACDGFPDLALWVVAAFDPDVALVGDRVRASFRLVDRLHDVRSDLAGVRFRVGLDGFAVFDSVPVVGVIHAGGGTGSIDAEFVDGRLVVDLLIAGAGDVRPELDDERGFGLRLVEDSLNTFETSDDRFRDVPVDGIPSPRPWERGTLMAPYTMGAGAPGAWSNSLEAVGPFALSRLVSPESYVPEGRTMRVKVWCQGYLALLFFERSFDDGATWDRIYNFSLSGFQPSLQQAAIQGPATVRLGIRSYGSSPAAIGEIELTWLTEVLHALAPDGDDDGDGIHNDAEMAAGTDPLNEDTDGDHLDDGVDNCPLVYNHNQLDSVHPNGVGDACDDPDGDGVVDLDYQTGWYDNCPDTSNPDQSDVLHPNGIGDACDDGDLDGVVDQDDVCPLRFDPHQADRDVDGIGDACDVCPDLSSGVDASGALCADLSSDGGQCVEARFDTVPDYLEITPLTAVTPQRLTFRLMSWQCDDALIAIMLNGTEVGTLRLDGQSYPHDCRLYTATASRSVELAEGSDLWSSDGDNEVRFEFRQGAPRASWIAVDLENDDDEIRMCLWDNSGRECREIWVTEDFPGDVPTDAFSIPPTLDVAGDPVDLDLDIEGLTALDPVGEGRVLACGIGPFEGLVGLSASGISVRISPATGRGTTLFDASAIAPSPRSGFAFDPASRRSFAFLPVFGGSGKFLVEYDPLYGDHRPFVQVWCIDKCPLEVVDDMLVSASSQSNQWTLRVGAIPPAETPVAFYGSQTAVQEILGLAYDPASHTVYGAGIRRITDRDPVLFKILIDRDNATIAVTDLVDLDRYVGGMAFGPDGTLYGAGLSDDLNLLLAIDPETGITRVVGNHGWGALSGLVWAEGMPTRECLEFTKDDEEDLAVNGADCGPPTADAGPDHAVECSSPAGTLVELDGSASSDPNSTPGTSDDIVAYVWSEAGSPLADGVAATVVLPLGEHAVDLTVTDTFDTSDTDRALITVADTTPPELTCPAPREVRQCLVDGMATVELEPVVAEDVCAGPVGADDGTGGTDLMQLPVGLAMIEYVAVDPAGQSASCTTTIDVLDPPRIDARLQPVTSASRATGRSEHRATVRLTNLGGTALHWTATGSPSGIVAHPAGGTIEAGASVRLLVDLRWAGLSVGGAPVLRIDSDDPCRESIVVALEDPPEPLDLAPRRDGPQRLE